MTRDGARLISMLKPTALLGISLALVASSLVACSAPPGRKNLLPVEDAPPGSTTRSAPSESEVLTPTASPSSDSDRSPEPDADADADVDATTTTTTTTTPAPSCAAKVMSSKAPATFCSVAHYTYSGGTLTLGEYYLSRWADGSSSCTCPYEHRGTMSIEQVGDQLYMRWTRSIAGEAEAGTYLLAFLDATTMSRSEVCSEGTTPAEPTVMSYTATSNEVVFGHAGGQERWTAIP